MPLTLLTATPLGASMNVHSIVGHRALNYFSGFANGTAGLPPAHASVDKTEHPMAIHGRLGAQTRS